MKKISWNKVYPHLIAIAIFLIIAVVYCKPALQGKELQQSDLIHWQGMAQSSFEYKETHGHFPLWINSMFSGMPGYQVAMDADNPISLGYLHHVFTLFLPAPFSFFFLLCISFYFLSQVLKVDYRIGILGAIGYAYASFTPIIVTVGHITQVLTMGYLPFLLGAIFLVFQKKYWIGAALSSIFATLLIAQNHTQVIYYFLLIAVFAAVTYYIQWIKAKEYKHILITTGILVVAAVVGFTTNLVSLATTMDYAKATMRGGSQILDTATDKTTESAGLPIDYAFNWSYGQAETFTLLVPDVYGGSSDASELDAKSNLAKEAIEKGVPDDQAEQFAKQFPTYWGEQPSTAGPVYLGAVICLLFVLGMVYLKRPDKWWIAGICLLAILMSWGHNFLGFNTFLFNDLPFYNKFRAPTMSLVIPQFLFPLLGILALQQFIFDEKDKIYAEKKLKIAGYVMLGLFVVVGMLYISFTYKASGDDRLIGALTQMTQGNKDVANDFYNALKQDRQSLFGADILRSLLFAAAAFGVLWLLVKSKIKPVYAVIGILLISSIDLIAEGRRYLNYDTFVDASTLDDNYFTPTAINKQILQDTSYYRVYNMAQGDPFSDALTSYFHNSIGGYHPAKLSIYEDLLNFQLRRRQPNIHVLDMLNTKYVIVPDAQGQKSVQQNPGALGPCWFVKAIDFEKSPGAVMTKMNDFDPKDTAVIDDTFKTLIPFMPVADSSASITLIKNDNDVVTYQSKSSTNQFAVFSEIFYDRGWKAYIDEKEATIIPTNYVLRGLPIPAGNHTIRFEFKPAAYYNSLKMAIAGSALGWIIILGAAVQVLRKRKTATNV